MKLLIVGSRSIKEFDLSPHISEETEVILSGGAMGIDRLAEEYADKHRLSKIILRPHSAGLKPSTKDHTPRPATKRRVSAIPGTLPFRRAHNRVSTRRRNTFSVFPTFCKGEHLFSKPAGLLSWHFLRHQNAFPS